MCRLLVIMALVLTACGGPAVCGPFDGPCRAAAQLAQQETGIEPAGVREEACGEAPQRCFWFSFPSREDLGIVSLADGEMAVIAMDAPAAP